jgi:Zn-dependent protease
MSVIVLILAGMLAACIVHESGHLVAALALGVRIKRVGFCWLGPYVQREHGTDWRNLIITLAGPFASALGVYVGLRFYMLDTAVAYQWVLYNCGMFALNCLPIPRSDALRAIQLVLALAKSEKGGKSVELNASLQ